MKVLFLHGFSQNANKFKAKTRGIQRCFSKNDELVFLDAPIIINSVNDQVVVIRPTSNKVPAEGNIDSCRAWWTFSNREKQKIEGIENTLEYLEHVITEQGPFDGVVGFSQGAILASILCSLIQSGKNNKIKEKQPPFKFAVIIGGSLPLPSSPLMNYFESQSINVPSLHVIGKWDTVVPQERSLMLAEKYQESHVLSFEGGHIVPLSENVVKAYRIFLSTSFPSLTHSSNMGLGLIV